MSEEDAPIIDRRRSFFSSEQIDATILSPEAKATIITRKVPRMVRTPIYLLDTEGNKVPAQDEKNRNILNDKGEMQYIIKDYETHQDGWKAKQELLPASEPFSTDDATSHTTQEQADYVLRTFFFYNFLAVQHDKTASDYSGYLHKLRNDAKAILHSRKSIGGETVKAVKTFYTKSEGTNILRNEELEPKKKGLFAKLWPFGK
jgi:hypothetical protein